MVGDSRQAIYGFAGADTEAMTQLCTIVGGVLLPLSVNYRCSKAVIDYVQKLGIEIQACDWAPEGSVKTIAKSEWEKTSATAGDYVICRTTAPLVQTCLKYIREEKRATVLGREIGEGLIAVIDTLGDGWMGLKDATDALRQWYGKEADKVTRTGNESRMAVLTDKYETLLALLEGCSGNNIAALKVWVQELFSDATGSGVTFMTGHKCKGLEADNVFVLRPDLLPHPAAQSDWQLKQESNLKYVICTRARLNLTFVEGK